MGTSFHSAPDAGPVIFQGRTLAMLPSRPLALAASPCRVTLVRGGRGGIRQLSTRGKGAGGARHARGGGRGVVREGHWRGTWDAPRFSSRDRSSSGALWSAERRCRASEIRPAQIHESGQTESEKSKDRHGPTGLKLLDRHSRITVKLTPPGSVSVPPPRATYTSTHAAQYRGTLDLGSARWIPTCSNPSASCTSALVSAA